MYKAVHRPGGNYFDDVRLDLPASYAAQDEWLRTVGKTSVRSSGTRAALRRAIYRREPYRLREGLVNAGIKRSWFEEFRGYWESVLDGRPITVLDFHSLRFHYRRQAQTTDALSWSDAAAHIANWQTAPNIFHVFDTVYRTALHPMWGGLPLANFVRDGFRVLEYGCGNAPMYRTWRTFFNTTSASWTLADIPAFAFHFARHTLARDAEAEFVVIEDFDDPLATVGDKFDLIIMQTVFEHLDEPRRVAEYLCDRLKPGGLFWFDYIRTAALGLDTPTALSQRQATLEYLTDRLKIVHGTLHVDERSLGTCVGIMRT